MRKRACAEAAPRIEVAPDFTEKRVSMPKDRAARKAAKAAKGAAPAEASAGGAEAKGSQGKKKKKNPLVKQMREQYVAELKKQGVPDDQIKQKVRTQLKDVLKPAMKQAKESAKTKNLKGAERRKFIQDAVRGKTASA